MCGFPLDPQRTRYSLLLKAANGVTHPFGICPHTALKPKEHKGRRIRALLEQPQIYWKLQAKEKARLPGFATAFLPLGLGNGIERVSMKSFVPCQQRFLFSELSSGHFQVSNQVDGHEFHRKLEDLYTSPLWYLSSILELTNYLRHTLNLRLSHAKHLLDSECQALCMLSMQYTCTVSGHNCISSSSSKATPSLRPQGAMQVKDALSTLANLLFISNRAGFPEHVTRRPKIYKYRKATCFQRR